MIFISGIIAGICLSNIWDVIRKKILTYKPKCRRKGCKYREGHLPDGMSHVEIGDYPIAKITHEETPGEKGI